MERRYRALLIGNSIYREDEAKLTRLAGPPNDLVAMHAALTHPEFGLFAADDVLIRGERTSHELTSDMETFFGKADSEDVLLLYFSCHGRLDDSGRLRLCAANTRVDRLISTAVLSEQINDMIDGSAAAAIVVILDCCYSGAFKNDLDFAAPMAPAEGRGRYVMAACRARQLARDAPTSHELSLFTQHVAAGLTGRVRATAESGFVSFDDLYRYVHREMTAIGAQTPIQHATSEGALAIARFARDRWIASTEATWVNIATLDDQIELRIAPKPTDTHASVEVVNRRTGETQLIRIIVQAAAPVAALPGQRQQRPEPQVVLAELMRRVPQIKHLVVVGHDALPVAAEGIEDRVLMELFAAGVFGMCNGSKGAVAILGDDAIVMLLAEFGEGTVSVLPMPALGWLASYSAPDADLGVVVYESAKAVWPFSTKGGTEPEQRQWLLDDFVDRISGVESCMVSTKDGFPLLLSGNLGRDFGDRMAAAVCSFFGSVSSVGRQLRAGALRAMLIETRQHYLLSRNFGPSARPCILTVVLSPSADLGVCVYEAEMLETLIGRHF